MTGMPHFFIPTLKVTVMNVLAAGKNPEYKNYHGTQS